MTARYFLESPPAADMVSLSGPEAHHLIHVMRAKTGEQVVLFDGSGAEYVATVCRLQSKQAELEIVERRLPPLVPTLSVTLGVALPKGDRQKWLVEKLVELGVTRLVPLVTQRGVAQPNDSAVERLRRGAIEACKQCGRNHLLEISPGTSWATFLTSTSPDHPRFVAHPGGSPLATVLAAPSVPLVFAIGPEGGFTDDEISQAQQAGFTPLSLGPLILRIETAAVLLASLCVARTN